MPDSSFVDPTELRDREDALKKQRETYDYLCDLAAKCSRMAVLSDNPKLRSHYEEKARHCRDAAEAMERIHPLLFSSAFSVERAAMVEADEHREEGPGNLGLRNLSNAERAKVRDIAQWFLAQDMQNEVLVVAAIDAAAPNAVKTASAIVRAVSGLVPDME